MSIILKTVYTPEEILAAIRDGKQIRGITNFHDWNRAQTISFETLIKHTIEVNKNVTWFVLQEDDPVTEPDIEEEQQMFAPDTLTPDFEKEVPESQEPDVQELPEEQAEESPESNNNQIHDEEPAETVEESVQNDTASLQNKESYGEAYAIEKLKGKSRVEIAQQYGISKNAVSVGITTFKKKYPEKYAEYKAQYQGNQ